MTLTRIVQELDLHGADLFGLDERLPGHAQVIRAADVPVLPVEDAQTGDDAVRVAAQTPTATVLVGHGGPDHYLPPTISPRQVIALVLEGTAEAHVGDEIFELAAGDTLIIPPLAPHGIRDHRRPADADRLHHLGRVAHGLPDAPRRTPRRVPLASPP